MPGPIYHLIPHTHWDREWYLTRAAFLARLVPMLDDLVVRLEADADLHSFLLDGQTVLIEDYLAVRPEMTSRIRSLVRAGRLQVGPWYVLADELVPSGESLVRNLLLGRSDSEELGARLDVLYSPDAFGHPAAWPALAAEFGIRYGVLWRGLGGEAGQEGDLFRWRAPDGREVLLHHLSPEGYEAGSALPWDAGRLALAWPKLKASLEPRARTAHVAVFLGADHHAAYPCAGRLRELIAELEPAAEVRVSRLDEYFAAAAAAADAIPVLTGELRWSYGYTWTLQGVHATRAPLKRLHDRAELALERLAEPLVALALLHRRLDARPMLAFAWRTLVRSQFHDSIGGCTSDAVARRVESRLADAAEIAGELARGAWHALAGYDPDAARARPDGTQPRLAFFNPVPRRRSAVVVGELSWFRRDVLVGPPGDRTPRRAGSPTDPDIAAVLGATPYQVLGRRLDQERLDSARHYPDQDEVEIVRVALVTPELDGFGLATGGGEPFSGPPVRAANRRLDNGLVEVFFSADGLVILLDRATGVRYDRLLQLESEGDGGDTYSFAPVSDDGPRAAAWSGVRTLAAGPLVGALEARTTLRSGAVRARLVLALYAGSPLLRCTIELENGASDHRLRLRIPTGQAGADAVAGGPFGPVRRPPARAGRRYRRETPVATAPAQRFVASVSDGGGLVALAPGFLEYEHDAAGDLTVTLLRAVGQLSREDLPTRPGHAGWPVATPEAQCLGRERLQLAIRPVGPGEMARGAPLAEMWEDAFLAPRVIWLRQATELDPVRIDLRLHGEGLVFSALKPAAEADGVVLRCYNAGSSSTSGRVEFGLPLAAVARVRADERGSDPLPLEPGNSAVRFTAGAHEIVTLLAVPA